MKTRREAHAASPAFAGDTNQKSSTRGHGATNAGAPSSHQPSNKKNANNKKKPTIKRTESKSVFAAHPGAPKRVRVFVLTYFFSSLTIDRWRLLWGLIPIGWIFSSLAEWLGVPICHTNVQVRARRVTAKDAKWAHTLFLFFLLCLCRQSVLSRASCFRRSSIVSCERSRPNATEIVIRDAFFVAKRL